MQRFRDEQDTESWKAKVWPDMAAKPHLHILMRIDSLLPCLHDPSRAFMWAGSLTVIIPRYRPVCPPQRAGDILPCAKHKRHFFKGGDSFFLFSLTAMWKRRNRFECVGGKRQDVAHMGSSFSSIFPPRFICEPGWAPVATELRADC